MNLMLSKFAVKQKQHIRFIFVLFYFFNFFLVSRFFTTQIYVRPLKKNQSWFIIKIFSKFSEGGRFLRTAELVRE